VSRPSLQRALPVGERVLLDASCLIAYLDGREAVSSVAAYVVDECVRPGRNPAVVSAVTVMELLVRPLRLGAREPYRRALDFLTRFPNLRAAELDIVVAQEAAALRAPFGLAAPDALVVASGVVGQVHHLITNDRQWRARLRPLARRIAVLYLADHLPFP
jgi:predicted nucleic acid-binding protein